MDFEGSIIEILGIGCTGIKGGEVGAVGIRCLLCPIKDKRNFF